MKILLIEIQKKVGLELNLGKDLIQRELSVEHDGMPVGFFDYEVTGDEAYCCNIQLSGDYQGRNIGIRIFHLIEKGAREDGARSLKGKVFRDNRGMVNWVVRLGFKIVREIPEENSYVVRKELCGS